MTDPESPKQKTRNNTGCMISKVPSALPPTLSMLN